MPRPTPPSSSHTEPRAGSRLPDSPPPGSPPPGSRPSSADRLRWAGAADLCLLLRRTPGLTRAQAARELGLSSGTAADLVARMRRAAILDEAAAVPRGRGRPTPTLTAHDDGPLVIGVEITATTWRVATAGLTGELRVLVSAPHAGREPDVALAPVRDAVGTAARDAGRRVRAVSVSVAATVRDNRVVQSSVLDWERVDLGCLAAPGARLLVANDATLAAVAESRRGASRGAGCALHLTVLTGVGGGLVVEGLPLLGATGSAMEVGHLPLGSPDAVCDCGARGCWDTELGSRPLARRLGLADDASLGALLTLDDPEHQPAVESAAASLGRGLAGLVNLADPEVVTLGGLGPTLRRRAPEAFETALNGGLMRGLRADPPRIVAGDLGADAALVGAVETALDEVTTPAGLASWASTRPEQ